MVSLFFWRKKKSGTGTETVQQKPVVSDTEKIDPIEKLTSLNDAQTTIMEALRMGTACGEQVNFKIIKTIRRTNDEMAMKGLASIRTYSVVSPVNRLSSMMPFSSSLNGSNSQAMLMDILEHAEMSGCGLSYLNQRRISSFIKDHLIPEIERLNAFGKKGDAITFRIMYRPPVTKGIKKHLPPVINLSVHDGDAGMDGKPSDPAFTDIVWANYKLEPLSLVQPKAKKEPPEDDLVEMK